jgi:endonuclease YncB( thermonuclease family)
MTIARVWATLALVAMLGFTADDAATGRCVEVITGDTIRVDLDGKLSTFVLEGIDAPDGGQSYSAESKDLASNILLGKILTVTSVSREPSGEIVARVFVGDLDVSHEMLAAGAAWHDTENNSDEELLVATIMARGAKMGLWADPDPVPPSTWRELYKSPATPTPKPRRLGDVADRMELKEEAGDDADNADSRRTWESVSADAGPNGEILVRHRVNIPELATGCLNRREGMPAILDLRVETSNHYREDVRYLFLVRFDAEQEHDRRREIRYEWIGRRNEDDSVQFECSALVRK